MKPICKLLVTVAASLAAVTTAAADVVVNGTPLDPAVQRTLEGVYQVAIQPGRYWYDALTGLWGREGGPAAGIIHAGLRIAGPLRRDASNGHTGTIVNGRELHSKDVEALQRCRMQVMQGRFWVLANGVGGNEGGPPWFNVAELCGVGGGSQGGLQCDGNGSCGSAKTRSGVTGLVLEGNGGAGMTYNGKYIMTP